MPLRKRISVVAQEVMGRAQPLGKPGRPAKDREKLGDAKVSDNGTTADYLAARIKRDRPDIAEAVERGATVL